MVRLVTKDRGLYSITWDDLFGRRQHRALPTSNLRLSRQGEVVTYHVEPRADRFEPGSRLYFVSEGAAANPFGDEAVYELELAPGGLAMAEAEASPSGELLPYYWHTERLEQNRYYQAGLVDAPDLWLWELVMAPDTREFPFSPRRSREHDEAVASEFLASRSKRSFGLARPSHPYLREHYLGGRAELERQASTKDRRGALSRSVAARRETSSRSKTSEIPGPLTPWLCWTGSRSSTRGFRPPREQTSRACGRSPVSRSFGGFHPNPWFWT